jgi:hypothetical protein
MVTAAILSRGLAIGEHLYTAQLRGVQWKEDGEDGEDELEEDDEEGDREGQGEEVWRGPLALVMGGIMEGVTHYPSPALMTAACGRLQRYNALGRSSQVCIPPPASTVVLISKNCLSCACGAAVAGATLFSC